MLYDLLLMQSATHSASVDTQRELQSAAHIFYQQVVRVLRQKVQLEREHPGLFSLVFPHGFLSLIFLKQFLLIFISVTSRFLSASFTSHYVFTKFLLPTSGPSACHQIWHFGNPLNAYQQQVCSG